MCLAIFLCMLVFQSSMNLSYLNKFRHVLMECTMARNFWHQAKELTGVKLPQLHPHTWAKDLIDPRGCSEKSAATILCGMWSLWMARNKRRHSESSIPMRKAVEWARDTAYDLWQRLHPIKSKCTVRAVQKWQRTQPRWIKCNVDASFQVVDRRGATGQEWCSGIMKEVHMVAGLDGAITA